MPSPSSSDLLRRLYDLMKANRDALLKDHQTKFCCDGNPRHLVYKSPEAFEIGKLLDAIEKQENSHE